MKKFEVSILYSKIYQVSDQLIYFNYQQLFLI